MALKGGVNVLATSDFADERFDSVVLVSSDISYSKFISKELEATLSAQAAVSCKF